MTKLDWEQVSIGALLEQLDLDPARTYKPVEATVAAFLALQEHGFPGYLLKHTYATPDTDRAHAWLVCWKDGARNGWGMEFEDEVAFRFPRFIDQTRIKQSTVHTQVPAVWSDMDQMHRALMKETRTKVGIALQQLHLQQATPQSVAVRSSVPRL